MKIGIDKIGFAMPKYFLDIRDLSQQITLNILLTLYNRNQMFFMIIT